MADSVGALLVVLGSFPYGIVFDKAFLRSGIVSQRFGDLGLSHVSP